MNIVSDNGYKAEHFFLKNTLNEHKKYDHVMGSLKGHFISSQHKCVCKLFALWGQIKLI